ncbi:MAG: InlB B-repeat-containing protein, partial [Porcipelethomonas sp.]
IYENQKHYCACGKESTEHEYDPETGICECGAIEGHEHVLDDNCNCTDPRCGATDLHTWEPVPGKKYHQCAVCGATSSDAGLHEYVGVYDSATETYKHICACGYVDYTHEYGEADTDQVCICQVCGMSRHLEYKDANNASNVFDNKDITLSSDNKSHTCKLCGKTVGHLYDNTYNCEIAGCTSIKTHTPVFDSNADSADPRGFVNYAEVCVCGKETLEHDLTLNTDSVGEHICANVTDGSSACNLPAEEHDFTKSGDVDPVYCLDGCGTVNPAVLADARGWAASSSAKINALVNSYRSAYIVSLTKAVNDVLAYDIKTADGVNKSFSAAESILLAKTDAQQAAFEGLLDTFEAVVADKENNKAGSSVTVNLVTASSANGAVYALDSEGKKIDGNGTAATQVGKVGEEVSFVAEPKQGYSFAGWYASATPADDATPVSTDVILTKAITDGSTSFYAAFEQNATVQIKLPAEISYRSTITQTQKKDLTNGATPKFVIGEVVYIWPTNLGSKSFMSFTDRFGKSHAYNVKLEDSGFTESDSGDVEAYKFEVKAADSFTLNTYSEPSGASVGEYYIVFRNGDNDLAYGETTNKSAAGFQPDDPAMEGNVFGGWAYSDAPNVRVQTKLLSASGILVPIFNKITGLKITIGAGGRFVLGENADKNAADGEGFEYGASVALTADEKSGDKFFSGWYIDDVLVSKRITEYFTVKDNLTIIPKYEGDEELVAETTYTLTSSRSIVDSYQRVVLSGRWAMADEAVRIVDTGFVYSATGKTNLSLDTVDGSDIRMKSTGLTSRSGSYDLTLNLKSSPNATVTGVFYVTYVDASGNNVTVYTDLVTSTAIN